MRTWTPGGHLEYPGVPDGACRASAPERRRYREESCPRRVGWHGIRGAGRLPRPHESRRGDGRRAGACVGSARPAVGELPRVGSFTYVGAAVGGVPGWLTMWILLAPVAGLVVLRLARRAARARRSPAAS